MVVADRKGFRIGYAEEIRRTPPAKGCDTAKRRVDAQ